MANSLDYAALALAATTFEYQCSLFKRIAQLNTDEQRVLTEVLEFALQGLEKGRASYGPMELATDKRDLEQEAREELRDGQIYLAASKIRQDDMNRILAEAAFL